MRSKLFVPGHRPELFAKALAGAADAVSFDLEDAVPAAHKAAARARVAEFVRSAAAKLLIVRVNAPGTPYFEDDIAALAGAGLDLINLPKVESAADVLAAVAALERVEAAQPGSAPPRLLINIETPRALSAAAAIAGAHPRVAGLQLGLGDLFEPLGIDRRDRENVRAAMFALRLAAGAAGVFACDGAFADIEDADGYRAEALMARRLGYVGKTCIHPKQIALANEVFRADAGELAMARRVVEAARTAAAEGRAAFVVDGHMVDPPFLKRAEALLASVRDDDPA